MAKIKKTIGADGHVQIRLAEDKGDIDADGHALALLGGLTLNRFYSKDGLKSRVRDREGALTASVNKQETTLSWATMDDEEGTLKNPGKFAGQILFVGKPEGNLDFNVNLLETDQEVVKGLTEAKSTLSFMGSLAGLVPGAGLVGAGFGLVGAIVDFIRGKVDDDLELNFLGSIGRMGSTKPEWLPLRQGRYEIFRRDPQDPAATPDDLVVPVSVHSFKPLEPLDPKDKKKFRKVMIVLDSLLLDLQPELKKYELVFEASVGTGKKYTFKHTFKAPVHNGRAEIDNVFGITNKVLYVGPWEAGVPFHFSIAGIRSTDELAAIKGLVDEGAGFLKELSDDDDIDKHIVNAKKAAQSLRSLIMEFLPEKISVGTLGGLITPKASIDPDDFDDFKKLQSFKFVSQLGKDWRAIPSIRVSSRKGGSAIINLSIKRLA